MRNSFIVFLIGMSGLISLRPAFGQSKLSVSISASPVYRYINTQYRTYLPDGKGGSPALYDVHARQNGNGYAMGLMAHYNFSNKWSLSTGLFLNQTKLDAPTITTNPDLTASPNGPQFLLLSTTVRSFQVPLSVNYRTSTKRLSPYLSVGALTSVYSVSIYEGGLKSQNTVKEIRPNPTLGAGIDYRLNDHFSLIVQPTFVYFFPYGKFISHKSYQMGLQAQLLCKF